MSKTKILVIEDTADVRENIVEILELDGYEVFSAANGKIGASLALEVLPDLVLCDIMMPELDGYGVLRILQGNEATRNAAFVFLTAKAEKTDFRKGMTLGADDYITKPFEVLELLDTIKLRLSRQKRSIDQPRLDQHFQQIHALKAMEALRNESDNRALEKGERLFRLNEQARYLFFLEEGKLKSSRFNEAGKELITDLFAKGSYFGIQNLISGTTYQQEGIALSPCKVQLIAKDALQALLQNDREVNYELTRLLSTRIELARRREISLAYDSVRQRVAKSLLLFAERFSEAGQFSMPISREDLAALTGTAKETLIRNLSDFKEEGIVRQKEDGSLEIVDDSKLKAAAN